MGGTAMSQVRARQEIRCTTACGPAGRSPEGRGGGRASAALPLLDDVTTSPASRRLASARPALAPKCTPYFLTGPKPELSAKTRRCEQRKGRRRSGGEGIGMWLLEGNAIQKRALLAASLGRMLDGMAGMLYSMVLAHMMRDLAMSEGTSASIASRTLRA